MTIKWKYTCENTKTFSEQKYKTRDLTKYMYSIKVKRLSINNMPVENTQNINFPLTSRKKMAMLQEKTFSLPEEKVLGNPPRKLSSHKISD